MTNRSSDCGAGASESQGEVNDQAKQVLFVAGGSPHRSTSSLGAVISVGVFKKHSDWS
jgi:hypothetical protein